MFNEPKEIIIHYYNLLYSGDLIGVKELMTEDSYLMTLESFGLRLSFEDTHFKRLLNEIKENKESLEEVEVLLSKDLIKRGHHVKIDILNTEMNGSERQTVNYKENNKVKKLYFSKEEGEWKINYFAGRKVN